MIKVRGVAVAVASAVVVALTGQVAASTCDDAEKWLAGKPFRSWNDSHSYYKRFRGQCSDGALLEALSAQHTALLANARVGLRNLKVAAAKEPAYLEWVVLGVFYNPEESDRDPNNTACRVVRRLASCEPDTRALCAKLSDRVGPSAEYMNTCKAAA